MDVMISAQWTYPLLTGFGGHQRLSVHLAINAFPPSMAHGCGDYTMLWKASDVSEKEKKKTTKLKCGEICKPHCTAIQRELSHQSHGQELQP